MRDWWWRLRNPVYPAGPVDVVCKRWWSPKDRKHARLAAKLIAYQWENDPVMRKEIERQTKQAAFDLAVYGTAFMKGPKR